MDKNFYILKESILKDKEVYVFHYLYTQDYLKDILRYGKLLPINILKHSERYNDYASRIKTNKAEDYFEEIYNKRYKPILKISYKNYGIYLTSLDLFPIDKKLKYRFKIPFSQISKDPLVLQIGADVVKLTSEKQIIEINKKFPLDKVRKIYNSSKFKFKKLPQIVDFADFIKVNKNMLEINSN